MKQFPLSIFLFGVIVMVSCNDQKNSNYNKIKESLISTNPKIDTSQFSSKQFTFNNSEYNIAFNSIINDDIYIYKNYNLINKIDSKKIKGVITDIQINDLTFDQIPELIVYTHIDGGKFSQSNAISIFQNCFSNYNSNLIFSQIIYKEVSTYNEDLVKQGSQVLIDLDVKFEKNSIIYVKGKNRENSNINQKYKWNKISFQLIN